MLRIYLGKSLCSSPEIPLPLQDFPLACYNNSRRLHDGTFLPRQKGHTKVLLPQPRNLTSPLERPSRISLSFSLKSAMSEYEFSLSESRWPAMLAETIEERKRKINCKILQVQSGESNTPYPLLIQSNGDDSLGNVDFPRRIFLIDSPRCVPNVSIQWRPFAW